MFSCTNLSASSSKSHHIEKTQHDTAEEPDKKSVRCLTESLVECIETQSEITTGKMDQCSAIGGGDGPSIVDIPKTYDNTQRLNKNTEITQERLFGD